MESLVQSWRRVSATEVFRRSSKGNVSTPRRDVYGLQRRESAPSRLEHPLPHIFGLPTELHALVLSHVDFDDLCALRLVSRDVARLLIEGDVIRKWLNCNLNEHELSMYPPPKPATFIYLAEQHRRKKTATELGQMIATYIENEVLSYRVRSSSDHQLFRPIWHRVSSHMVLPLTIIQQYLEDLRDFHLEGGDEGLGSGSGQAADLFKQRVARLLSNVDPETLLLAHKCWLFLAWSAKQLLKSPSYALPMERAVRGWTAATVEPCDLRKFFLFGNLSNFMQLVRRRTNRERRKVVESLLGRLDPQQNISWQRHWTKLGPSWYIHPSIEQVTKALETNLEAEDIWVNDVRHVLVEQELLDEDSDSGVGTPAQALEFLTSIAGYDVLHESPPSPTAT